MKGRDLRLLLVMLIGGISYYTVISRADDYLVFDGFIVLSVLLLAAITLMCVFYFDTKAYGKGKQLVSMLPTFTGVLLAVGLSVTMYLLAQRDASPVRIACQSRIIDFNGIFIDFREDGTYKLNNSTVLGGTIYRGIYTQHDSIILLDKGSVENVIESNRLLVKADGKPDSAGSKEKSIYQVDESGKIINGAEDFRVTVYK